MCVCVCACIGEAERSALETKAKEKEAKVKENETRRRSQELLALVRHEVFHMSKRVRRVVARSCLPLCDMRCFICSTGI